MFEIKEFFIVYGIVVVVSCFVVDVSVVEVVCWLFKFFYVVKIVFLDLLYKLDVGGVVFGFDIVVVVVVVVCDMVVWFV